MGVAVVHRDSARLLTEDPGELAFCRLCKLSGLAVYITEGPEHFFVVRA